MENASKFYATGKRKTSVARTWLKKGTGNILVNGKPADEYFTVAAARTTVKHALILTDTIESYDVMATVAGGGISGQAGALRHGIAKALLIANPELRNVLKKAGLITRDSRAKERKKYGLKAARARFQFSKR